MSAAEDTGRLEAALRALVAARCGRAAARVEWLAAGLGLRRFARVHLAGPGTPATLVARIEAQEDPAGRPAGAAPEPPLAPIRALLERRGLPVPARLGADEGAGIELLEDAGDVSLERAARAADAAALRSLYEEACDLVPQLQRVAPEPGVAAFARRLDDALLAYKRDLFCAHALPAGAPPGAREAVHAAFRAVADAVRAAPGRLAHRDLQSANVLVRAERPRGERLVLIDLQGAFLAPPEYDLVCLLRDSYVELSDAELAHQLARVRPRLPDAPDAESFARRFDLLTLSRKGKDLARFLHAERARGELRYRRYVPTTLRALRAAAARAAGRDPALAPFAALVAALEEPPCAR